MPRDHLLQLASHFCIQAPPRSSSSSPTTFSLTSKPKPDSLTVSPPNVNSNRPLWQMRVGPWQTRQRTPLDQRTLWEPPPSGCCPPSLLLTSCPDCSAPRPAGRRLSLCSVGSFYCHRRPSCLTSTTSWNGPKAAHLLSQWCSLPLKSAKLLRSPSRAPHHVEGGGHQRPRPSRAIYERRAYRRAETLRWHLWARVSTTRSPFLPHMSTTRSLCRLACLA